MLNILLVIMMAISLIQSADDSTTEQYSIEHQVSDLDAFKIGSDLLRYDDVSILGCPSCSWKDEHYCRSQKIIDDHCCCEGWHDESFPYIPHICYDHLIPGCTPNAGDCEDYQRLNRCCCQNILRGRWVPYINESSRTKISSIFIVPIIYFIANR